jgi:hypothetical protein
MYIDIFILIILNNQSLYQLIIQIMKFFKEEILQTSIYNISYLIIALFTIIFNLFIYYV